MAFITVHSGMFFSIIWAFLMPSVTKSVYFHNTDSELTDQPTTSTKNYSSTAHESKMPEVIESQHKKIEVI